MGIVFEFESPPVNAACAMLLLFVMAEAVSEAEAEAAAEARGFTLTCLELISIFTLKTTINLSFKFSSERPPRIYRNFRFLAKLLINFRSDRKRTVICMFCVDITSSKYIQPFALSELLPKIKDIAAYMLFVLSLKFNNIILLSDPSLASPWVMSGR